MKGSEKNGSKQKNQLYQNGQRRDITNMLTELNAKLEIGRAHV